MTEKETRALTLTQPMNLRRDEANGPEWGNKKQKSTSSKIIDFFILIGRDFSDDWISIDKHFLHLFLSGENWEKRSSLYSMAIVSSIVSFQVESVTVDWK